jgi:hypothetical protein
MSVCYRKRKIDLTLPQCLVRLGRTGLARPVRSLGREQKTCTQLHGEPVAAFGIVSFANPFGAILSVPTDKWAQGLPMSGSPVESTVQPGGLMALGTTGA